MTQPLNDERFRHLVEPYRREIQAHCYRMVGSVHDAEDLVQESLLRAWKAYQRFDGRQPRAWLYRIATNACLDALEKKPRRMLPLDAGPATADPLLPLAAPLSETVWLEPYPDAWLGDAPPGPDARCSMLESVAFAFLAALQLLPPRQRAVLVLRDVLGWSAAEAAETLELTVAAANSALQRARETLETKGKRDAMRRLSSEEERSLLTRFVQAWQDADIGRIVGVLREDVVFTMPPTPTWYRGRENIAAGLASKLLAGPAAGRFLFLPTSANGLPAWGCYCLNPATGRHGWFGLMVVRVEEGAVAEITLFGHPRLYQPFALPVEAPPQR